MRVTNYQFKKRSMHIFAGVFGARGGGGGRGDGGAGGGADQQDRGREHGVGAGRVPDEHEAGPDAGAGCEREAPGVRQWQARGYHRC